MTLRRKTLLIVGLLLAALVMVLYATTSTVFWRGFGEVERQRAARNRDRATSALSDCLKELDVAAGNWASWGETYAFMGEPTRQYLSTILSNRALVTFGINVILLVDPTGGVIFGRGIDLENRMASPVPSDLLQMISAGSPLLQHPDPNAGRTGIILVAQDPLLVASRAIVAADSQGPPRGSLIVGRYLDEGKLQEITSLTSVSLTVQRLDTGELPADFEAVRPSLANLSSVTFRQMGEETLSEYALLPDITGKPALMLRVDTPRDIFQQGQDSMRSLLLSLVAGGLVFGGIILLLLETSVLSRLSRLSADVVRVGASGNVSSRIAISGRDELSRLGYAINSMLAALERSRREHEEDEERYRAVVEQSPSGVALFDPESGSLLEANAASHQLFGYAAEEAEGLSFLEFLPGDPEEVKRRTYDVITGTRPFKRELQLRRKDGTLIDAEIRGTIISYGGKRVICVTTHDTTDRKRAEEALQRAHEELETRVAVRTSELTIVNAQLAKEVAERERMEEGLRFLVEASRSLASSLDYGTTLQGITRLAIPTLADICLIYAVEDDLLQLAAVAAANPAKEKLLREMRHRYPMNVHSDSLSAKVFRTGTPEFVPEVSDSYLQAVAQDAEHLETLRRMEYSSRVTLPMVARGKTWGVISFIMAESGRRYTEAVLSLAEEIAAHAALAMDNARLYQEAQQAISARDEFLSVAAHELKTPMTSLRGFAQLAMRQLDRTGAMDPARARQALQVIDQQSKKLASLVEQLLDVSRIESGTLPLDRQVTDVTHLVREMVANIQATSDKHTIAVSAPSPILAWVDPLRLEQVVTNLIDNAVKYSPDGGAVDVEVTMTDAETFFCLTVRDHGIGVSPEHRPYIFDRFYQAHANQYYGGMGLGLYITSQIVHLHGGRIEAEFPVDGGTRFVVHLPVGDGDESDRR